MEFKDRFNHESIVEVLATATYGSDWLAIKTAKDKKSQQLRKEAKEKGFNCMEDIWAYVLEHGGKLVCWDGEEDEEHLISMEDYKKGFDAFIQKCPRHYADLMEGDGDYYTSNVLIQCVLFEEEIYG
jgi:hypothetical protein